MAPIFDEVMCKIFNSWTTLALAVDQSWGGRDSRSKKNLLQEEVVQQLAAGSQRRRPPTHENPDDVATLSTYLYQRMDELFNTEIDDNSDDEVAFLCLKLFNACRLGDMTVGQEILDRCQASDLSKSQGANRMEYATEEDELLDAMQTRMDLSEGSAGSDDDMEDGADVEPSPCGNNVGSIPVAEASSRDVKTEPVVDDDGFTPVVRGRRAGPRGGV